MKKWIAKNREFQCCSLSWKKWFKIQRLKSTTISWFFLRKFAEKYVTCSKYNVEAMGWFTCSFLLLLPPNRSSLSHLSASLTRLYKSVKMSRNAYRLHSLIKCFMIYLHSHLLRNFCSIFLMPQNTFVPVRSKKLFSSAHFLRSGLLCIRFLFSTVWIFHETYNFSMRVLFLWLFSSHPERCWHVI